MRATWQLPLVLAVQSACLLAGGVAVARAEQLELEEVIVTAQKRAQSLRDVPIAVSAISGEKITEIAITGLEELTLYTPNVKINSGALTPNLFIRGIGSGTNQGFEQSVGMYIDGVYSGRGQLAAVPFTMDLERVEILKGPQGTLFGKNTIAGAINITTAKPTDEFEGMASVLYEPDHGEQIYDMVLSGPLSDDLAGRVAVRYEGMDGWWKNQTLGEEGPNKDNWYARGSLRWDAAEDIEVLAKYEYGDFSATGLPTVVYKSDQPLNFLGQSPFPVISDRSRGAGDLSDDSNTGTDVAALTVNWNLDFATFTSISAYSAYDNERPQNTDSAATPTLNRYLTEDFEQYSQELRLVSAGDETLDWIIGGYYEQSELDISRLNLDLDFALSGPLSVPALVATQPGLPSRFDQDGDNWALFAQTTYQLFDRVRVGGGIRYTEETKQLDKVTSNPGLGVRAATSGPLASRILFANPQNGELIEDLRSHSFIGLERQEEKFTWSGNLQWDVTDDAMLYASISTGFKAGGYDESYSNEGETIRLANPITGVPTGATVPGADPSVLEFEDETVLAYEVGAKLSLLGGAAELNLAAFRMEYDDLQVSSLVGDVLRVGNAGQSVSQGLELDGRMLLSPQLVIAGSIAWLDAYYEDFTGATCTVPQTVDPANHPGCLREDGSNITAPGELGGQDLGDETLLFAPDWSANLSVQHFLPLGENWELQSSLDLNYSDDFYSALDLDPNTRHDSYVRVSARLALAQVDGSWSFALVGKNLTDENTSIWNNDVPVTASNSYVGLPERPRSIAIQVRYRLQ